MTVDFTPLDTPSSTIVEQLYESTMAKQSSSTSFFNDLSKAKQWSEIETTLAIAGSERIGAYGDEETGWMEGRVHETRSTQKEIEILLVHLPQSSHTSHIQQALRIFINCPEFSCFVFAINQDIKISLSGARIIRELVTSGSSILPFSLVFSTNLAIQSVRGGACMPDGVVVDTRQSQNCFNECICLESAASRLSLEGGIHSPSKTSPRFTQKSLTPLDSSNVDVFDEYTSYPALNSLTEGMMTPLLGIVETLKPPSPTASGELCVGLTLADASSYESKRGFRVTCFTSKSRLARDLPDPAEGDAILLKAVKITKWPGGIIGTVYPNKLDWISYNPANGSINVPRHAKGDPVDSFYEDMEKRKELFRQFVAAMESGPWKNASTSRHD